MRSVQTRLLALFILALSGLGAAEAQERVALVVGNGAYEKAGILRTPANDAADISAALAGLGFAVTTVTDADGDTFSEALAKFGRAAQGAEIALFWYAGHAIRFNEANHLLPIDARLDNEFALRRETFALADIVKRIEASAKVSLIFIDASHETPLVETLKASFNAPERAASVGRGLARIENRSRNTLIVFSAPPGEVVGEGSGRNSPFAAAMLEHIETPNVDVEVMLKDVTSDVRAATDERQRPQRLSRLESKVVLNDGGTVRGIVPVPAGQAPQAAEERRDEAIKAEERRQKADREAEAAAQRKRQAEQKAREAEERTRRLEEEARRKVDEAARERRDAALREAKEAEQRKRNAEQEAAAAEERRRKAEEEARLAEKKAREAEERAGRVLGDENREWQDHARRRREALDERREAWKRRRAERRRQAEEWFSDRQRYSDDGLNPGMVEWWRRRRERQEGRGRRWRYD